MPTFETRTIDMGPCECPGTPHGSDSAIAKERFTFGDLRRIAWATTQPDYLLTATTIARGLVSWSLTDEDRKALPIAVDTIDALSQEQGGALRKVFDTDHYADQIFAKVASEADLPEAPGGPSPSGIEEPASSISDPSSTTSPETPS